MRCFSVSKIWFRKFWHHSSVGRSHRWLPVATGGSVALYYAKILTCSNFDRNWHCCQFLDVEHDSIIHFFMKIVIPGSLMAFSHLSKDCCRVQWHSGPRGEPHFFWCFRHFTCFFERDLQGGEPLPGPRVALSRDLPDTFTKKCYYPRLAPWCVYHSGLKRPQGGHGRREANESQWKNVLPLPSTPQHGARWG